MDRQRAQVLADEVDELASTRPTAAVWLLPGFDQTCSDPAPPMLTSCPQRAGAVSKQSG